MFETFNRFQSRLAQQRHTPSGAEYHIDLDACHRNLRKTTQFPYAIGQYADLYRGTLEPEVEVAIKVIRGVSADRTDLISKLNKSLTEQAKKWCLLNHPNVGEFLGFSHAFGYMPAMVLLYYCNGNIVKYIQDRESQGVTVDRLALTLDVAKGLEYLHSQDIIHGDLRAANILVDDSEKPRICDFGLLPIIEQSKLSSAKTAGNCRWMAPEIMNPPDEEESPPFTKASDIYAFSMTTLEIFTLKTPFHKRKDDSSIIFAVLKDIRPELPKEIAQNPPLTQIVKDCWDRDPTKRPSAQTVVQRLQKITGHTGSRDGGGWMSSILQKLI
ncbi:hypothetical protein JAAARDRAFT_69304 [Jaapia argillacea MUCL 33604]|uniref:Protein kinase domain-containing protein n=1 Tax=Jaapia argillacea MUCL 33604 TaxID=933084 RepID=A0A067PT27_9AGAM|nr:hypothetical protein JAAARDRAFT_69304 [Jaapia argillacea MUCL 33604]